MRCPGQPLLRPLLTVLVDKERSLRLAAHGCLFELLLPREPLLGFNSFLGMLFALNGCVHAPHHPRALPEVERKVVEMAGEGYQRRRLQILRLLLNQMSDEHKLQVGLRDSPIAPPSAVAHAPPEFPPRICLTAPVSVAPLDGTVLSQA